MKLKFINAKDDRAVWRDIKKLYFSAFPKEERFAFCYIKRKSKTEAEECIAVYDNGIYAGLLILVRFKDVTLLFYFAVADNLRGKGYGTEILNGLKEFYPDDRIILMFEIPDENSPNNAQRLQRKAFYEKNGFCDCGYITEERGVKYKTYSYGGMVSEEEFTELLINYIGKRLFKKYYNFYDEKEI